MKKTVFIAALAVVAMASCTKNEISQSTRTNEIKFATPVLARHTKSVEITDVNYPQSASFNVYAWYNSGNSFDAEHASPYMTNVQVSHDPGINDATEGTGGAWVPADNYYWPKQGVLTFDAYSPNGLSGDVTATAEAGITVTNHVVSTTLASQQDFLYATRAKSKTSSTGTNATYDGVDIAFNHALAVVKFQAKTADDYHLTTTIKIKDIKLKQIKNIGTFNQNESTSSPAWSDNPSGSETYVALENNDASTSTPVNTELSAVGSSVIVLPQTFAPSTQELYIEYYIKTSVSNEILQTKSFYLNTTEVSSAEYSWAIGKRYTYNIVFSLDKVYFAPSVDTWDDITVDPINVQ